MLDHAMITSQGFDLSAFRVFSDVSFGVGLANMKLVPQKWQLRYSLGLTPDKASWCVLPTNLLDIRLRVAKIFDICHLVHRAALNSLHDADLGATTCLLQAAANAFLRWYVSSYLISYTL